MQLTEQQELVKKLAHDFAEKELTDDVINKAEEEEQFSPELRKKMGELGFYGVKAPRKYGGAGADTVSYTQLIQELTYRCHSVTMYVTGTNMLTSVALLKHTTPEQKEKYLKPVIKGDLFCGFALTEPGAGSDAAGISTHAVEDGDDYILNGRKTFITGAPLQDICVIFAKTDPAARAHGITAFIVDLHAPGVTIGKAESKMGIMGCPTSDIILENVRVPKSDILGKVNQGFKLAMSTLDSGRLSVAAQSVGTARRAFDEAVAYAKERREFGKPISKFEGISFTIAEMAAKLRAIELMVYDNAVLMDKGELTSAQAAMGKYLAADTCNWIVDRALQIFGGYGYMKDYVVERLYRDARVLSIYEGTAEVQKMVISNAYLRDKK